MSIDPSAAVSLPIEAVVDLTAPSSSGSGDSFSRPLRLPSHLSPHAGIRVSDGHGGARTVELIDLIKESRTDASARANLRTLASAAAADPNILNRCYVSSEENLLPMLAQLGSTDPVARREGALALRHFILNHPEDRTLQQGLVATVADIARDDADNREAREVLADIARNNSPQNTGLRQWMQRQADIAPLVPSSASPLVANAAPNGPVAPGLPVGAPNAPAPNGSEVLAPSTALLATASPASPAVPLSTALSEQLVHLIENRTAGTPLEGIPTEGILSFAQNHANLPAGPFEDLLRLRILADALPLNGFTGNLFGASSTVAGLLAEDILRAMNRERGASGGAGLPEGTNAAQPGSDGFGAPAPAFVATREPGATPNPGPLGDAPRASLGASFPNAALSFFVPSLLTSLSGMQGLASQSNSLLPTPLATLAQGLGGRPSYHVEGPTALDGDGHEGFGGGSGHGSGQEGGEHRDERREGADAYLA
ncbi:MAG: hypothetical protein U1F66_03185 [bacterium]